MYANPILGPRPAAVILASLAAFSVVTLHAAGPVEPEEPAAETADTEDEVENRHDKPIVERDGKRLLWAGETLDGRTEWFDMTDSTIDPERFQFGIGKDTIGSVDDPVFVDPDDRRLAKRGIDGDSPVLGVEIDGIARAYPVVLMELHEVVNDRFAGEAYAVLW